MRAIVVASNAVGPECGRETRGYEGSRPQRASGMARTFTSVRPLVGRDAIQIESALVAAGRSGNQMNLTEAKRITPAALNFSRPFEASGSLISARVNSVQEPARGFTKRFEVLSCAVLSHRQQSITKGFPSESKPEARSAKSAARGGNVSS